MEHWIRRCCGLYLCVNVRPTLISAKNKPKNKLSKQRRYKSYIQHLYGEEGKEYMKINIFIKPYLQYNICAQSTGTRNNLLIFVFDFFFCKHAKILSTSRLSVYLGTTPTKK